MTYIPKTDFVDKLPSICVELELISVYDVGCKSIPELLYLLSQKINATIESAGHNDRVLEEALAKLQHSVDELLETGIAEDVIEQIQKLLAEGYFAEIIDAYLESVLTDLDDENIKAEIYLARDKKESLAVRLNTDKAELKGAIDTTTADLNAKITSTKNELNTAITGVQTGLNGALTEISGARGGFQTLGARLEQTGLVFDTMEDLKTNAGSLPVGTVVEVLGYNAVADGAGHKRIISATDDGSGVIAGGKWANYLKNKQTISNSRSLMKSKTFTNVAHRGFWKMAPENSIKSIAIAHKLGFEMVELDARFTSDGHLMLMHDATLDRTTDGIGNLIEKTYEEAKQLKLKGSLTEETMRIPSFEEAVAYCASIGMKINIDSYFFYERPTKESVMTALAIIDKYNYRHNVFFMANHENMRKYLMEIDPTINFGMLVSDTGMIDYAKTKENMTVGISSTVSADVISEYVLAGVPVFTYNCENESTIQEMRMLGAMFAETNTVVPTKKGVN